MKYLSFSLENYKGIKNFDINVNIDQPITLVGLNESGKTTILEGIRDIGEHCKNLSEKKGKPLLKNGDLQKIKPKTADGKLFSNDIRFSCKVKEGSKNFKISFVYTYEKDRFSSYSVVYNDEQIYFKDEEVLNKINNLSTNIPDIIYYSDFNLEVPDSINFSTSFYKESMSSDVLQKLEKEENKDTKNVLWQEILQDITNSRYADDDKEKVSFKKDIVDYLDGANAGNENSFKDILTGFSNHINDKITDKWLNCMPKQTSLKKINLIVTEPPNTEPPNKGQRNFSFEVVANNGTVFYLSSRSKGCQWFFAFMLFTEFRKYRRKNSIFLLDEPASNLHCSIQEEVIKAINILCDDKDDTGAKVLYSTHTPYLLDIKNLETMYLVKNKTADEVKDADIVVNLLLNSTKKRKIQETDLEEKRPVFDYFKLNTPHIEKYLKKVDKENNNTISAKFKDFSRKFISGAKTLKNSIELGDFLIDLLGK